MKDTPITKLSPFIIEKNLNSFIKAKFVKKKKPYQQYPADRRRKKFFLRTTTKTKILLQHKD